MSVIFNKICSKEKLLSNHISFDIYFVNIFYTHTGIMCDNKFQSKILHLSYFRSLWILMKFSKSFCITGLSIGTLLCLLYDLEAPLKTSYEKLSLFSLVGRVFTNGPGDPSSIPGCVIPKTLKMVLDTFLLNTQQYKVHIKGKVEQSWERSSTLPYSLG